MKAIVLGAMLTSILMFAARAPRAATDATPVSELSSEAFPASGDMTCHEACGVRCAMLWPNNPSKQQLCTWSCIDQRCGGGPYPIQ